MSQQVKTRRDKNSPNVRRIARRSARVALRLTAIALFIAFGLGAGIGGVRLRQALRTGELFALKKISVQGLQKISQKELLDYSGVRIGDGLYAFSRSCVEEAIAEHPLIQKVQILRRPPHELRIFISEYQAQAYVALDKLYTVDKTGKIFARAEVLAGENLPVISGIDKQDLQGDEPSPQVLAALKLIKNWAQQGFDSKELAELHFDKDLGLSLELSGALQEVHLGQQRWAAKLLQLKRLRTALVHQGRQAKVVRIGDGRDPRRVIVQMESSAVKEKKGINKKT